MALTTRMQELQEETAGICDKNDLPIDSMNKINVIGKRV